MKARDGLEKQTGQSTGPSRQHAMLSAFPKRDVSDNMVSKQRRGMVKFCLKKMG